MLIWWLWSRSFVLWYLRAWLWTIQSRVKAKLESEGYRCIYAPPIPMLIWRIARAANASTRHLRKYPHQCFRQSVKHRNRNLLLPTLCRIPITHNATYHANPTRLEYEWHFGQCHPVQFLHATGAQNQGVKSTCKLGVETTAPKQFSGSGTKNEPRLAVLSCHASFYR